jgi:hypothetical protein
MNYTIEELLNTSFILLSDRGRYSQFIGEECVVNLNPKNNRLEITKVSDNDRCYRTNLHINVLCYRKDIHPEHFL